MATVTQSTIKESYEKMLKLPQEKLVLLLRLIDQLSNDQNTATSVRLGIADGKYHIPEDINQYDTEVAEMFGVMV